MLPLYLGDSSGNPPQPPMYTVSFCSGKSRVSAQGMLSTSPLPAPALFLHFVPVPWMCGWDRAGVVGWLSLITRSLILMLGHAHLPDLENFSWWLGIFSWFFSWLWFRGTRGIADSCPEGQGCVQGRTGCCHEGSNQRFKPFPYLEK